MPLTQDKDMAMIRAVEKHNLKWLLDFNSERIVHFKERIKILGLDTTDVVIVLLNVDDPQAAALAENLMPGYDWQAYRDRGEIPIARGLAGRPGIQEVVNLIDIVAGQKLESINGVAIVVMDCNVVDVFEVK